MGSNFFMAISEAVVWAADIHNRILLFRLQGSSGGPCSLLTGMDTEAQVPDNTRMAKRQIPGALKVFNCVLNKRTGNGVKGIMSHSGTGWPKIRPLTETSDFGGEGCPKSISPWIQSTGSQGQSSSSAWLGQGEGSVEVSNSRSLSWPSPIWQCGL